MSFFGRWWKIRHAGLHVEWPAQSHCAYTICVDNDCRSSDSLFLERPKGTCIPLCTVHYVLLDPLQEMPVIFSIDWMKWQNLYLFAFPLCLQKLATALAQWLPLVVVEIDSTSLDVKDINQRIAYFSAAGARKELANPYNFASFYLAAKYRFGLFPQAKWPGWCKIIA